MIIMNDPNKEFRVVYSTDKYQDSIDFYSNKLGLHVLNQWDRGDYDKGIIFQMNGGSLEILQMEKDEKFNEFGSIHISIEVEDVNNIFNRIKNLPVTINREIKDYHWRHRSFSLSDPNGLHLTMFQKI